MWEVSGAGQPEFAVDVDNVKPTGWSLVLR